MYEARWFSRGNLPEAAKAWLKSLGAIPDAEPMRSEVYLRRSEQIGVKISRGNLELKYRPTPAEPFTLKDGSSGSIETWTKTEWQYRPKEQTGLDPVFEQFANPAFFGARFRAEKNRILMKFDATRAELVAIKAKDKAAKAFLVELVSLTVDGHGNWWSLQFEFVGDEREGKDALKKRMEWALALGWPSDLRLLQTDSMGYPGLFERLAP